MSDTILGIGGAILIAIFLSIYFAYRRRLVTTKRLMTELLNRYFDGDLPADQVGQRAGEIASRRFLRSAEFYSVAISAFQRAADAKLAHQAHSIEDERQSAEVVGCFEKRFWTDRSLSDRRVASVARIIRS